MQIFITKLCMVITVRYAFTILKSLVMFFHQTKTSLSLASSDEVKEVLLSSRFASEVCDAWLLHNV